MTDAITIQNLDPATLKLLVAEAKQRGLDVNTLAGQLLRQHFEAAGNHDVERSSGDLEILAGTWTDEEVDAFLAATSEFSRVDEELWK